MDGRESVFILLICMIAFASFMAFATCVIHGVLWILGL